MSTNEARPDCCIERNLVERAQPIIDALRAADESVITAESCTGGLIAAVLSHGLRASESLHGGFVVYTKANKARVLGVDAKLLESAGSVNEEVARQLAQGALDRSPATIALAVTGVLGPDPDEDGNPPGLVYFAVCKCGKPPIIRGRQFTEENPDVVRRSVMLFALDLLQQEIKS